MFRDPEQQLPIGEPMRLVALFFVGALLCNCIPHLVAGLQGSKFPTPFAKPRGVGESSPLVNFIWGLANLLTGLTIFVRRPIQLGANFQCLALAAGALLLGIYLSQRFARVRAHANSVVENRA
jgi:hypothetical protein